MKDNSMLFLLVWLWKYYGMNRTSHSPGTICLCRWGGSHMCFLYTWSRQGGCGVPSDPLLVFLIALLNLWAARDPHTSHNTRFLGRGRAKGRRLQRQQRCICCSYLPPPKENPTSINKATSFGTVYVFLQHKPCFHNHADEWKANVY